MEITDSNKYSTKDIAKWIREQYKKEFPDLKISVVYESYSGGSSIHISLMESKNIRFIKKYEEITELQKLKYVNDVPCRSLTNLQATQESKYHQLNQYSILDEHNDYWCNGVFLTTNGTNILRKMVQIAQKYNWDNSDAMTDYFDVNYYLHINLGKYDKDFIDGVE